MPAKQKEELAACSFMSVGLIACCIELNVQHSFLM
jgi:hypothetical protein